MCGLFGWSLKDDVPGKSVRRAYRVLSQENDRRGGHSFGAYLMDRDKVARGLGKMSRAKWKQGTAPVNCERVLCHTRYATHGDVTVTNAHPFRVGKIIGAHNGIIYNHLELNDKFNRAFKVDSQHIFAHLSEGLPLDSLRGYGAVTYVNVDEPKNIYLGRFCLGELAVARLTGGRGIVWSSDYDHLKDACRAAGWTYELLDIEDGKLYVINDREIYDTASKLEVGWAIWKKSEKPSRWQDYVKEAGGNVLDATLDLKANSDEMDPDEMDEEDWVKYMLGDEKEFCQSGGEG